MHRLKKYIFFCFVYINWLKLLKKHGKKWCRSDVEVEVMTESS